MTECWTPPISLHQLLPLTRPKVCQRQLHSDAPLASTSNEVVQTLPLYSIVLPRPRWKLIVEGPRPHNLQPDALRRTTM
jgi:hypothetical protein